ncbi:hypothetical protein E2542_SST21067 [Spatholobus suberectus]|nr:hypothetical protein E2542_SST21067 [Spatholobus suberectus]
MTGVQLCVGSLLLVWFTSSLELKVLRLDDTTQVLVRDWMLLSMMLLWFCGVASVEGEKVYDGEVVSVCSWLESYAVM